MSFKRQSVWKMNKNCCFLSLLRFAIFLRSQNDYYFTTNNRKTTFESKNNVGTDNAWGKKIYNTPKGETCFRLTSPSPALYLNNSKRTRMGNIMELHMRIQKKKPYTHRLHATTTERGPIFISFFTF